MMRQPTKSSSFAMGRLICDLLLATAFAFGAVETAHAAPTTSECLEKAQADYDSAVSACRHWASDPDPYVTCLNEAAFAHHVAYKKCQKIIRRPPALPPVDKPIQRAPSR